jgi:glycopeptide antibiotics resistance protein
MLDYEFLFIISIPIFILFLIILIWKKLSIKKIIISSLFYFYIITLIAVAIFPIPIGWLKEIWTYGGTNNFIPFASISNILFNDSLSFTIKMKQIIGNIILFIPMWFLIPLIFKSQNSFKKVLLIWILASFSIELLQYIISLFLGFSYKVSDVDDILLNGLGVIISFILFKDNF